MFLSTYLFKFWPFLEKNDNMAPHRFQLLKEVDEKDGEGVRGQGSLRLFVQPRDLGPVPEIHAQNTHPGRRICILRPIKFRTMPTQKTIQ